MNERTNTLLYKNIISHTLFLKGWRLLSVREELETGQTAILTQQYLFLVLAGLLNRGSLWAQSPLSAVGSQFGILSPTDVFFKIPKFSAHCFRAWRHSHSSPIFYLGFIMAIVIVISSAHERKLYPMSVHLK